MESLESNLKCVQALDSCTDHINEYENKSIRYLVNYIFLCFKNNYRNFEFQIFLYFKNT